MKNDVENYPIDLYVQNAIEHKVCSPLTLALFLIVPYVIKDEVFAKLTDKFGGGIWGAIFNELQILLRKPAIKDYLVNAKSHNGKNYLSTLILNIRKMQFGHYPNGVEIFKNIFNSVLLINGGICVHSEDNYG